MSFDELNKTDLGYNGFTDFEAGAQSRQNEIDELQNKYDAMYRAFTVADDCRKEWHRCYVGIRQREDELQKRIDEAMEWIESNKKNIPLSEWHGYTTEEYVDADDLFDILKWKNND